MKDFIKKFDKDFTDPFYDFARDFFGVSRADNMFPIFEKMGSGAANIKELDDKYIVDVSVPGYKKEDIKINIEKGNLIVSSEDKSEAEDNSGRYNRKEFHSKSFKRAFTIPDDVKMNDISAKCENGILTVEFPKKEKGESNDIKVVEIK
jgi:HSP20 family protein